MTQFDPSMGGLSIKMARTEGRDTYQHIFEEPEDGM